MFKLFSIKIKCSTNSQIYTKILLHHKYNQVYSTNMENIKYKPTQTKYCCQQKSTNHKGCLQVNGDDKRREWVSMEINESAREKW